MMKKRSLLTVVAILVILVSASTVLAYFSASASQSSNLTVGEVKISLAEPAWNAEEDHIIAPGESFDKDPQVKNEGDVDCYVRMQLTISDYDVIKEKIAETPESLYEGSLSEKWVPQGEPSVSADEKTAVYTYIYQDALTPGQSSAPLFQKVVFPDGFDMAAVRGAFTDQSFAISVSADAVQSETFESAEDAFEALDAARSV